MPGWALSRLSRYAGSAASTARSRVMGVAKFPEATTLGTPPAPARPATSPATSSSPTARTPGRLPARTPDRSLFFGAGAVLTDLTGAVRSAYLPSGAVPPVSDAGYGPMVRARMQGKPGLSSVLTMADGRKLVALAVPVRRAGVPAGLLVGYIRMDRTGPSRQFLAGLPLGADVHLYAVDSQGAIGASTRDGDIGRPSPTVKALQLAGEGGAGLVSAQRGGVPFVTAYSQIGFGDWAVVID